MDAKILKLKFGSKHADHQLVLDRRRQKAESGKTTTDTVLTTRDLYPGRVATATHVSSLAKPLGQRRS